MLSKPTSIP